MIHFENDVSSIYWGSDKIVQVYYGEDLVYQSGYLGSYVVTTANETIYFNSDNTPFSRFRTPNASSLVNINGNSRYINELKIVKFGNDFTRIDTNIDDFLNNGINIEEIQFPNIPSFTSFNNRWLRYCRKLTSLVIPDSVVSIGSDFCYMSYYDGPLLGSVKLPKNLELLGNNVFYACVSLSNIDFGNFNANNGGTGFNFISNVNTNIRKHTTQTLADTVLAKYPIFSNWTVEITG